MRTRVSAVEKGHHLLVDGTLKTDDSRVNSLSDFSRKSRVKGVRDISILFAFDLEKNEPVCSKCFPGNMIDSTAYESFITENGITKGIIVGDKGFPSSSAATQFVRNKDLHYLNPLKRNSKYISRHRLHEYTGQMSWNPGILYKTAYDEGDGKYLYSFRDTAQAHKEDYAWLSHSQKDRVFSNALYLEEWSGFGTILLESDLDLSAEMAYRVYSRRWEIELVMRYYKQACEFDDTRVQSDYSVIGSEFCSFLASVITYRLIHEFDKFNLLGEFTYKKLMAVLKRAKQVHIDNEWTLVKLSPSQLDIISKLGLLE